VTDIPPLASGLTLRAVRLEDAPIIHAVTRAAYLQWVPHLGREPVPMQADYDKAVRENLIDVVLKHDAMVALIEMVPQDDYLYIKNVAVIPAFQGKGIGRHLLWHAERLARSKGLDVMKLRTNSAMTSNIALYRRVGYVVDAEVEFAGGHAVHMSKRLEDALVR
jgi:ribosomal protein S18 acetylase RimI-like enzyme